MLAADMQESADQATTAISIVVTAARPVAIVGKNSSMRSSNCTAFAASACAMVSLSDLSEEP
jgi:hypothetical protein